MAKTIAIIGAGGAMGGLGPCNYGPSGARPINRDIPNKLYREWMKIKINAKKMNKNQQSIDFTNIR